MDWTHHIVERWDALKAMTQPIKWSEFEAWAKGVRPFFVEHLQKHLEEFDKMTAQPQVHGHIRVGVMKPSRRRDGAFGVSDSGGYARRKAECDARNQQAAASERRQFQSGVDAAWKRTVEFVHGVVLIAQDARDEPGLPVAAGAGNKETKHVFVGHGRSEQWEQLASFLHHGLGMEIEEFNWGESPAGKTNGEHVEDLLNRSHFAFLVYTGEDEQPDGTARTRENVVEETGRCMNRFGPKRAIVVQETGCNIPSNLTGPNPIRFQAGKVHAVFEQVKSVLQREGML